MNSTHTAAAQAGTKPKVGPTFAAAFQYTGGRGGSALQEINANRNMHNYQNGLETDVPMSSRVSQAIGMNGYNATPDPPPPLYVRALYNYEADDHTSLSFRQGDIIQVLTQLESGWWDGVINDVRGWFPSNYCTVISGLEDGGLGLNTGDESDTSADSGTEGEDYEDDLESDEDARDGDDLHTEGRNDQNQEEAAFWIPQATPDGRLFYFNTLTGVSKMELPMEAPMSADETGPHDRTNFHVPDQTRPPPEMLARGYEQNEDDYDGSASEPDFDSTYPSQSSASQQGSSLASRGISSTTSMDSMDKSPSRMDPKGANQMTPAVALVQQADGSIRPIGTTATSFSVNPQLGPPNAPVFRHFLDDGTTAPLTWNMLVENMRASIDAYRRAIQKNERAEFVRRAEDISDHLRMLLAAGSGTTDNHSGVPSIISTNKALYPHFREMMSKFSKLVLSSHIAAADWPGPEAFAKCLQEADGVLHGVYGYIDVARQQRGEDIPRIRPGFIVGSNAGGNWQDNNLDSQTDLSGNSFITQDEYDRPQPAAALDVHLLKRVDDARRVLNSTIRQLEEQIVLSEKLITPHRQMEIGDAICIAAQAVIEQCRPWMRHIESVNLAPLGTILQRPQLMEFASQKQKIYDTIGELVAVCQAVTAPLADEWAETRGESLDIRLNNVRVATRQLESSVLQVGYTLQHLLGAAPAISRDHRMTDGDLYQKAPLNLGTGANQRPQLGDIGHSQSYTVGDNPPTPPEKFRRPNNNEKARQFFGQIPPSHTALQGLNTDVNLPPSENPWYLQLDHQDEVSYDMKTEPPQLKSGTLTGLVEQLTRHDRLDAPFNGTFLLTYRSFTTAQELFELLVMRFNVQPPAGLSREEYSTWEDKKQKPIRLRVVNILKSWFETYWMENQDEASQMLLERAHAFAQNTIAKTKTPFSGPLMTVIEQRMKGQDTSAKRLVLTLNTSAPAPILPKNMKKLKFLDIDATEFARQLTIVESKLYGKIKPIECLDKTWQKKPKDESAEPAPNVKSLILHSNQLTNWVAEMILSQQEVKKRVVVIKHFVNIADKCGSMNNFSTLTSIVSALGTTPIHRLNRTWAQVNPKTRATLESMRQLMASTKNFVQYRERLHAAQPPCIPFLGVYLTDLTFIEDGIASIVKNTELINFAKRAKTAEVIRDIQQYQNVPYSLNPVPDLQEWIVDNMRAASDVHEMYGKSLQIEPREKEEEKIARLLSESGFL